ncbi:unnamed protein product [Fraxinus pennsylvanica]|uniref:DNA replication licensing factor MCM3 n=1 Tax=Fraxinus pennsylvanica TaxID=56036 RepID=A0AAD2DJI2_9LAMI|nr:unnamed protein product [Fraxinus pennsylvanica]
MASPAVVLTAEGSLVRPNAVKSVHFCPATEKFTLREYRDITSNMGLPMGSVYPIRDENGNLLVTEYGLCTYKDHQTLSMQAVPENAAPGQLPRTVDVIVEDDLVDSCKPGDRLAIVGIYKALPGKSKGSVNGVFRLLCVCLIVYSLFLLRSIKYSLKLVYQFCTTILIANNVSLLNKMTHNLQYSNEDMKNIIKISERDDAFDVLANSLAPSIYGHLWIKKEVILLMLGGTEKNLKNGTHLRGCKHYRRRCKIRSPCCNEVYDCRHCHNEATSLFRNIFDWHEMVWYDVKQDICSVCDAEQPIDKGQFHCDDCGICRVGSHVNFFHYKKCGMQLLFGVTSLLLCL